MRATERISAISDEIKKGERVADIGTDHGYLPIKIISDGTSDFVIMSDISEGSLSKAMENCRIRGIPADKCDFMVGSGLETLEKGEVDTVVIAGLGGGAMIEILGCDIDKTRSYRKFIMEPRNKSGELRYWLFVNGFDVSSEKLVSEGDFVRKVITAAPIEGYTERPLPYPKGDIRWTYPEELSSCDPKLLSRLIGWKLDAIDESIRNMKACKNDRTKKIEELERNGEYLKELLRKAGAGKEIV